MAAASKQPLEYERIEPPPLRRDGGVLFATRIVRLIAYGCISVILALYLSELGMSEKQIGVLLFLTLIGDTIISLWLTTSADRIGRKKTLIIGAGLMLLGGGVFAVTKNSILLLIAATVGVISPSGNEVGPFLGIEQAALSQVVTDKQRTGIFAWYSLAGSVATAIGSQLGGGAVEMLHRISFSDLTSYRFVFIFYGLCGIALAGTFLLLSSAVEAPKSNETEIAALKRFFGLHESKGVVLKLSALFAIDSFGGGFVVQTLVAYWFHARFDVSIGWIGTIFFFANICAGLSHLAAAWVAKRFGLINTMFFTHLPSNVLLMMVPLMPNVWLAVIVLLLRFCISQMDVPTRQSYTMAVVKPDERSAAAGITGVARTIGASISPLIAAPMLGIPSLLSVPFYLAGGLKIVYDLLLYRSFIKLKPPEEATEKARKSS